jgi:hypothetical protein
VFFFLVDRLAIVTLLRDARLPQKKFPPPVTVRVALLPSGAQL